jgi:ATP-dependent phosphofructokinase / diphosphate-dependent phosphofructokinase
MSALIVGQSGGATAAINASLVGVIQGVRSTRHVSKIYGMRHGIAGLLRGQITDLSELPDDVLETLRRTPSAAIGTSRHRLQDDEIATLLSLLSSRGITEMALIGGNDSADASHRLSQYAAKHAIPFKAIAVPKTIDNDLIETDHCPGFGSAARFLANFVRDATFDTLAAAELYPVKFIEVAGRDAGWIAASCALGFGEEERDLLPLLYLPERPPSSVESIASDVRDQVAQRGWSVAVVPETLRDIEGNHLGGQIPSYVDPFGHPYFPSPAARLAQLATEQTGLRARIERPGSAARMSISMASPVDLEEAYLVGVKAAELLADGVSDQMVTLRRQSGASYRVTTGAVPLATVANQVRTLPDAFIGTDSRSITDEFRSYVLPLLGADAFPPYARLRFDSELDGTLGSST